MQFPLWLRKQSKAAPRHAGFRPRLEALEDRWLPSTLTVTNNLDSGAGSLRAEIAAAKSKDTIVFAPALGGQTITLTSGQLEINKSLTIQGLGAGLLTVSGDLQSRVFQVDPKVTVTLSGLTISNGYAGPSYFGSNVYTGGGGIYNAGTLTVSGCLLSGNHAPSIPYGLLRANGGGIYNAGTLTVSSTTLSGNQADNDGGGIFNAGTATISGCTLTSPSSSLTNLSSWQQANDGGGISNAGTMTVGSCTFSYNYATSFGGAIYNQGTLTVSNSAFSGNLAGGYGNSNNINGLYTDGGGNTFN